MKSIKRYGICKTIIYAPDTISPSFCYYVRLKTAELKKISKGKCTDTELDPVVKYKRSKVIRSLYLVINKYIKQLNLNIESKYLTIKKYLYVTYLKSNEIIEELNLLIKNQEVFNDCQKKYFKTVIITLEKTKEIIDKRMQYMMCLLLENTELPVDMIREILDYI